MEIAFSFWTCPGISVILRITTYTTHYKKAIIIIGALWLC